MMTRRTQLATWSRKRLRQEAQDELTQFERKEAEFRRKVRNERGAELQMPVEQIEKWSRNERGTVNPPASNADAKGRVI